MSDEVRLMRIVCNSLGFQVRRRKNYYTQFMSATEVINSGLMTAGSKNKRILESHEGEHIRTAEGDYVTTLQKPVISYVLVHKENR